MNNDLKQFSEERLIEIASGGFKSTAKFDEQMALARIALATKQAKLAFIPEERPDSEGLLADGWNACRSHMLYTPQPAHTEQDGWIKCSDRMPEEGGRYWCYVEEQNSLGKSHYQWNCSWNGDCWSDDALSGRVTHWMPLPAAPKPESE